MPTFPYSAFNGFIPEMAASKRLLKIRLRRALFAQGTGRRHTLPRRPESSTDASLSRLLGGHDLCGAGFHVGARRQGGAGDRFVPERRSAPVILPFEKPVLPPDMLNRHAAILLPQDRIGQVPAVHGDVAGIVEAATVVEEGRLLHPSRKSHVILAAGAADRRELPIAVEVYLDLSLAPPVRAEGADADDGAYEPTPALPAREDFEVLFQGRRIFAPEGDVQGSRARRDCVPYGVVHSASGHSIDGCSCPSQ